MKTLRDVRAVAVVLMGLVAAGSLSGCLAVGYTSGGGWFVWPGGLGLVLLIALVLLVLRRR